jgi:cold shock CspA family protein
MRAGVAEVLDTLVENEIDLDCMALFTDDDFEDVGISGDVRARIRAQFDLGGAGEERGTTVNSVAAANSVTPHRSAASATRLGSSPLGPAAAPLSHAATSDATEPGAAVQPPSTAEEDAELAALRSFCVRAGVAEVLDTLVENEIDLDCMALFTDDDFEDVGISGDVRARIRAQFDLGGGGGAAGDGIAGGGAAAAAAAAEPPDPLTPARSSSPTGGAVAGGAVASCASPLPGTPDVQPSAQADAAGMTGHILWYDTSKRFGYIKVAGRKDVFVHKDAVVQSGMQEEKLVKGALVEFDTETRKGKEIAVRLRPSSTPVRRDKAGHKARRKDAREAAAHSAAPAPAAAAVAAAGGGGGGGGAAVSTLCARRLSQAVENYRRNDACAAIQQILAQVRAPPPPSPLLCVC